MAFDAGQTLRHIMGVHINGHSEISPNCERLKIRFLVPDSQQLATSCESGTRNLGIMFLTGFLDAVEVVNARLFAHFRRILA